MNIPPDDNNNPDGGFNPGLGFDPNQSAALSGDVALNKPSSKTPLFIGIALVVAAGGYFAWSAKKTRDERVMHVKFMEEFQGFEKDQLGKFWLCTLGPNTDGIQLNDPNMVTRKVDVMFANDYKAYPTRVREECAQIAKDTQAKVAGLSPLPQYAQPLDAYGKSIVEMSNALEDWAKVAPEQVQSKMVQKNVDEYGGAWHAYAGGAPAPEVIAFDQFLHCAAPTVDSMKDDQALCEYLFNQCKDAANASKIADECGKLITDKPAAATKGFKATQAKLAGDDRDLQAIGSCLKKAGKGKMKDNLSPVGEKWVAFREAREKVLKVGAEALKE